MNFTKKKNGELEMNFTKKMMNKKLILPKNDE